MKRALLLPKIGGPHRQITRVNMVAFNQETSAVYLLDDDTSVLKATSRLLDSVGWKVEAFTDPIEFLERAATYCPELVVIDILMPEMNGLEVQTRLQRVSPSTRVIVLTARDDPSVRRMAMNAGASAFFIKGVESSEFLAGVKAAADSRN
ncbi:MAG TPA: response regulator [Candidatus Tectomicrobia bacterium]|nr:response regulator [Candidatus Tectomicrobia bacterium]